MQPITTRIESATETFVTDIAAIVRETVLESLGGTAATAPRAIAARPRPARPVGSMAGQKRSPEHLSALVADLGGYITRNPGLGIEAIARGMRITTRELNLPIKKLIADGAVTTEGEKRARKYFPRKAG